MAEYYRMEDGRLVQVVGMVDVGTCRKNASTMTVQEARRAGAYQIDSDASPAPKDGFVPKLSGHELKDGKWTPVYSYDPVVVTEEDYNRILEEHLTAERLARGYDTREPSLYASSRNPVWRQDAEDWANHVDDVMEYALGIINVYRTTGNAPSLEDFKSGIPQVKWSIPSETPTIDV